MALGRRGDVADPAALRIAGDHHEAAGWRDAFLAVRDLGEIADGLMGWDSALKSRGINPGTSADLT